MMRWRPGRLGQSQESRRIADPAKFLGDLTTNSGFFGGVLITTKTGTDQFAGEAVLGQSNGYLAGPSSC